MAFESGTNGLTKMEIWVLYMDTNGAIGTVKISTKLKTLSKPLNTTQIVEECSYQHGIPV